MIANQYICALYWALAAMTNLKGLPAHENRQCLELSSEVIYPIAERILTMCAFIFGAMVYAAIYGNIGSFLQTLDSSGLRYRKRMAEMNEFFNYHNVCSALSRPLSPFSPLAPLLCSRTSVFALHACHRCLTCCRSAYETTLSSNSRSQKASM